MSLARTALRIASCAALRADPVIAAMCGNGDRIYDSRIDHFDAKDPVPVIIVLTEDDKGRAWSANNGGPPFDHDCDLQFEIALRVLTDVPVEDGDSEPLIGFPETDAAAEMTLDLLEHRAIEAVTIADTPQAGLIRRHVLRRATELKSIRFASSDSGSKLALRVVTLSTHLKIDQPDVLEVPTGPFAALPQPLRAVAAAQPEDSSAYRMCVTLAAALAPTSTPPNSPSATAIDVIIHPYGAFDPATPPSLDDETSADPVATIIEPAAP